RLEADTGGGPDRPFAAAGDRHVGTERHGHQGVLSRPCVRRRRPGVFPIPAAPPTAPCGSGDLRPRMTVLINPAGTAWDSTMGLITWGWVVLFCLTAAWLILRRPVRRYREHRHADRARALFRQQREWLEARFLGALERVDPIERLRWEDAHWHDEVLWARD